MKVGTDGVLLGAWTDCESASSVLDVGSGTGLVSLMIAQRCNATVDAIDIEESAYQQSVTNFQASPFIERLKAQHSSLQEYKPDKQYDLIVSNPPFFSNSLTSPDKHRTLARHNNSLSLSELVKISKQLLSNNGELSLVLPFDTFNEISEYAEQENFFLFRKTIIYPTPLSTPKRILLQYSLAEKPLQENKLIIEESRHVYTSDFLELTSEYYL